MDGEVGPGDVVVTMGVSRRPEEGDLAKRAAEPERHRDDEVELEALREERQQEEERAPGGQKKERRPVRRSTFATM